MRKEEPHLVTVAGDRGVVEEHGSTIVHARPAPGSSPTSLDEPFTCRLDVLTSSDEWALRKAHRRVPDLRALLTVA
jgi:hypothetical protein